ncbi:hypothetical protein MQX03_15520 [Chryseobacterium aahli]|uniref:hypothetical protein n=1 Tax=Chryseobacterium aahli TaxID=1278643 RepID=UPI001F609725|nr:hypothetical protein [Chryseobacterium aahli]MCI3938608.1 hypothetical protein [Chryseobacterium aahli]
MTYLLLFVGIYLSAKNNDSNKILTENNQHGQVVIYENTSVYNVEAFENANIISLNQDSIEKVGAVPEIFISEGTIIYISKVPGINSERHDLKDQSKKIVSAKDKNLTKRIKGCQNNNSLAYKNPPRNSRKFSHHENKDVVFSENRGSSFSKATINYKINDFKIDLDSEIYKIIYQDPVLFSCFSCGRYSIRPPNSLII